MQNDERDACEILKKPLHELEVPKLIVDKIEGSTNCALIRDLWVLTPSELCRQIGLTKQELIILLNEMERVAMDIPRRRFTGHIERCRKYLSKDVEMVENNEICELNAAMESMSLDEIDFSCRVRYSLINAQICTIKDILMLTSEEIVAIKHLNRVSIKEIMEQLEKIAVPFSEMHYLRDAYNDYYRYTRIYDNDYEKLRNKVFQISLVEQVELIERLYEEKILKDENEQQNFDLVINELGFMTIEEFWKYELSEASIILFLDRLIEDTKENKIVWKSNKKYVFQTEDIRVFYAGKSLLCLHVTDREILFCNSSIVKASSGKIISEKIKELYILLDNKVRVIGRKDLAFFNWEKGDFEYPEWYSGVRIYHLNFDLSEAEFDYSDEYSDDKYFVVKICDSKGKWLGWSHLSGDSEDGFYYVSNEERAAIFTEKTLRCKEVVKKLQTMNYTVYQIGENKAKKYHSRIYKEL